MNLMIYFSGNPRRVLIAFHHKLEQKWLRLKPFKS